MLSALALEHADGATLVGIQHRADQPGFRGATAAAARLNGFRAGHWACVDVIHAAPPKLKHSMVLAGESFLPLVSARKFWFKARDIVRGLRPVSVKFAGDQRSIRSCPGARATTERIALGPSTELKTASLYREMASRRAPHCWPYRNVHPLEAYRHI